MGPLLPVENNELDAVLEDGLDDLPELVPMNNALTELIRKVNHTRTIADEIMTFSMRIPYNHELTFLIQDAYNIAYEDWEDAHNDLMNVTALKKIETDSHHY